MPSEYQALLYWNQNGVLDLQMSETSFRLNIYSLNVDLSKNKELFRETPILTTKNNSTTVVNCADLQRSTKDLYPIAFSHFISIEKRFGRISSMEFETKLT